ncbi:MAG: hypothetical protein D3917_06300 [Candidatus Electrothrix sp. AX5]|nr:hypothetical protein [Candidatus Electrothrix sp. AX5]
MVTGFEITEGCNPQYIQAQSLPEAQDRVDPSNFKWGKKHNLSQMRDLASREWRGMPWMGDAVEREYTQLVEDVVQKKTDIFNKPGFNKYTENNLIIYVNHCLPLLDDELAKSLCEEKMQSYWGECSFDNVFVEIYKNIHWYCKGSAIVLPLNDLWKNE